MKSLLQTVAGAAASGGLAYAFLSAIQVPRFDLGAGGALLVVVLAILLFLAVVAIHEAGHLIAGATQRFAPYLFIVGPVKLERRGSRWAVGRNRSISMLSGMAAGIPYGAERLRQRLFVLVAGGPAASLLSAVAGLLVLRALTPAGAARPTLAGLEALFYIAVLLFTVFSLLIALIALLPSNTEGYASDGSQLLRFRRSTPEVEAEVAIIAVSIASLAGCRPRDWDVSLLSRAKTLPVGHSRGPLARLFAHLHALDRGDVETARRHLQDALSQLEQVNRLSRPALLYNAAEFVALHDGDAAAARRYLEASPDSTLIPEHQQKFVEAAVRHAEGADGVEKLLDEAEAALPAALDRGGALMLADQIAGLRRVRGIRVAS